MEIKISLKKKHFWLLSVLILAVGLVIAYGGNDPKVIGHTVGEIEGLEAALKGGSQSVKLASGRVDHDATIKPIEGFKSNECQILLSMEDSHWGPKGTNGPNYENEFGDLNSWGDNVYGGAQVYTTLKKSSAIFSLFDVWKVTCRFGIHWNNGNPVWVPAKCKYLMMCSK